ncbi:MAG TPA: VWA domain-containing protein, partial [Caldilineaceae bacterium]|nr:VWA domain-containing protein [Caldilineaceae bacterium]
MRRHPSARLTGRLRLVHLLFCSALILALLPLTPVRAEPNACPAAPAAQPDIIERAEFCVYYNTANTTTVQATTVADHIQAYWDRYETDFGFVEPLHNPKLEVRIINNAGCNGGTNAGINFLTINNGCFMTAEIIQQTSGHELFHRVQLGYGDDLSAGLWLFEGTARVMEDQTFANLDNWPGALTAPFSFNRQVNEYLLNPNVDITSDPQRYNSALWWKYFSEQFGTIVTEPQRGVDAIRQLWEATQTQDNIAAVNLALSALAPGASFDSGFRRFVAANWLKDLTGVPGTLYNYIDEDEVGNPGPYGPIVPTSVGTIDLSTPASFANQSISRYGARYYSAVPSSSNCPVVSARFHTDNGPAFYHLITQKGSALDSHIESSAGDFTRSFFNDGLTRIVAIAGSTNLTAQTDITLECVNPVIEIKLPNNGAVANVGPHDGPGKFLAQVLVTNGSPSGPVVSGLTVNDFKVRVNGQNALINTGGFIQQQYWLVVTAPNQSADGLYDLEVVLEKSGTTTPIATDTNTASISYNTNNVDELLVIDRSGSMIADNKMVAARQAARFYVDISRNNDGVGVIAYNEDVNP